MDRNYCAKTELEAHVLIGDNTAKILWDSRQTSSCRPTKQTQWWLIRSRKQQEQQQQEQQLEQTWKIKFKVVPLIVRALGAPNLECDSRRE